MYRFNDCEIDPARRELRRSGVAVHLEPQAFDLLVLLIDHRDHVVANVELLDGVWGHRFISDANLTTRMKEARRAVGDDGSTQHTIRNIRGRGYRFVARLLDASPQARPAPPGLIGRDDDYARAISALGSEPFVTLMGPGGAGKTALARAMLAGQNAAGAFVDLSALNQDADVLPGVALALSISLDSSSPATTVAAIARRDILVVFDNCEHVVDGAADLIHRLMSEPNRVVRILATSRSRLGVSGEWVHDVTPLSPEAALALFDHRARAAQRGWNLENIDRERLEAMLAGIDRLPLTIEMAAARLGSMTFDDIVDSLTAGAPILQVSHRTSEHRHRNLGSLVSWSVGLLPPDRRLVFEDCAAFAGAFSVHDAQAVIGTGSTTAVELANLAERSLLSADLTGSSARYRMLQTIRSTVLPRFESSGRANSVRARHAHYFVDAAAQADHCIRRADEQFGRNRLNDIVPELRAAQTWAQDHDPALADALFKWLHLFTYSTFWNEPHDWARALLAANPSTPTPGAHLLVAGSAANGGDLTKATTHALAAFASPDQLIQAIAWEITADVAIYSGDYAGTVSATAELRKLAMVLEDPHLDAIGVVDHALAEAFLGDPQRGLKFVDDFDASKCSPSDQGWLIYTRGELLAALGNPAAAQAFIAAITLGHGVGNHFVAGVARMSLATELARAGDHDRALDAYADCLAGHLRNGNMTHALTTLRNIIELLNNRDERATALKLAAATSIQNRRVSYGPEAQRVSEVVELIRHSVDDTTFQEWWTTGAALGLYDAVKFAAAALDRHRADASTPPSA